MSLLNSGKRISLSPLAHGCISPHKNMHIHKIFTASALKCITDPSRLSSIHYTKVKKQSITKAFGCREKEHTQLTSTLLRLLVINPMSTAPLKHPLGQQCRRPQMDTLSIKNCSGTMEKIDVS